MPDKKIRTPSYRLHKPSGQAVVMLNGQDHYLGKHNTRASRKNYDELVSPFGNRFGNWLEHIYRTRVPPKNSIRVKNALPSSLGQTKARITA